MHGVALPAALAASICEACCPSWWVTVAKLRLTFRASRAIVACTPAMASSCASPAVSIVEMVDCTVWMAPVIAEMESAKPLTSSRRSYRLSDCRAVR